MYASELDGRKLTFGVSGKLWRSSLIMYDKQTNSEWSHILGRSMAGRLKGKKLQQIPCVMTDWTSWLKKYPNSDVLWMSQTSEAYRRGFYKNRGERFVLGIANPTSAMAWSFNALTRRPVYPSEFAGEPVVVMFDQDSVTARLYSRQVGDQQLDFFRSDKGLTLDAKTRSTWDPISGRSIAGPLKGKSLRALPAIVSYRKTWKEFHPQSQFPD